MLVPLRTERCANPNCWYKVNDDPSFGGFCCWKCHWRYTGECKSAKAKHGIRCCMEPAAQGARRAEPWAPQSVSQAGGEAALAVPLPRDLVDSSALVPHRPEAEGSDGSNARFAEGLRKGYIVAKGPWHRCLLCSRWATDGHVTSFTHITRSQNADWYGWEDPLSGGPEREDQNQEQRPALCDGAGPAGADAAAGAAVAAIMTGVKANAMGPGWSQWVADLVAQEVKLHVCPCREPERPAEPAPEPAGWAAAAAEGPQEAEWRRPLHPSAHFRRAVLSLQQEAASFAPRPSGAARPSAEGRGQELQPQLSPAQQRQEQQQWQQQHHHQVHPQAQPQQPPHPDLPQELPSQPQWEPCPAGSVEAAPLQAGHHDREAAENGPGTLGCWTLYQDESGRNWWFNQAANEYFYEGDPGWTKCEDPNSGRDYWYHDGERWFWV